MDFNQLMSRMRELDQPQVDQPVSTEGCGDPMGMPPPMPSMPPKPDEPPPSMSVNLNAQGLDNIESLMKLITKVNPDMDKPAMPPLPALSPEPSIMSIKPSMPPLKMLPDMDADNDDMPGGEKDKGSQPGGLGASLDRDSDGDHDMDDHDMEKKKDKEEAFGNSLDGSEPETKDMDAAIPNGNDLHKQKKSFSGKPYRGDNPMAAGAYESVDLRAQIRAELLQRLAEAKGAK
jgi:hypothetical protein